LSTLQDTLHAVPVVDSARVRAVQDALASGRYQIDAQAVADKLIRFDRELLA
jgi:flagellar biosynthesis anti-sigma factor FlgM